MDKSLIPHFITLLSHSNPNVRSYAAYTLGTMGRIAASTVPRLILLLQDPNSNVFNSASQALEEMGEAASPKLIPLLESSNPRTRKRAALALGHMGKASLPAIPQLILLLQDPDSNVLLAAQSALNRLAYSNEKFLLPDSDIWC